MKSTNMMLALIAVYGVIALTAGWEGNWPRVLYWVSAAGITTAVLWGMP